MTAPAPGLHVVGAGLIGTSVGLAAHRDGWRVTFEDANPVMAARAARRLVELGPAGVNRAWRADASLASAVGVLAETVPVETIPPASEADERAAPQPDIGRAEHAVDASLVCVAVPPSATASTLQRILETHVHATVMDVSSVKTQPRQDLEAEVADVTRVVWTHPLAGSEGHGPEAGRADLFAGRTWVVCGPTSDGQPTAPESVAVVVALIQACGARPLHLSAVVHDELLAATSHLPQLVASALAAEAASAFATPAVGAGRGAAHVTGPGKGPADVDPSLLAGPGLLDMTRLAGSPSELWAQVAELNREAVRRSLAGLLERLTTVERSLRDPAAASPAVRRLVDDGRSARAVFDRKHAGAEAAGAARAPEWAWVRATIDDVPGALAHVFAVAGELEVNIEDVRVDNAPYAARGTVSVAVARTDAARLERALTPR